MPFTISHASFAYPIGYINKKRLSITGLALGAMSPDFEYFVHMEPYRTIGHTWQGFFLQALPLSLIIALLFHTFIKHSLVLHLPPIFHLPEKCYSMLSAQKTKKNVLRFFVFTYSCFIGFLSHLLLDECTHQGGLIVNLLGYGDIYLLNFPLYKLLQYGLSLAGLILIATHFMMSYSRQQLTEDIPQKGTSYVQYWSIVFIVMIVTIGLKLMLTSSTNYVGMIIVAPITALFIGITVASIHDFIAQKKLLSS